MSLQKNKFVWKKKGFGELKSTSYYVYADLWSTRMDCILFSRMVSLHKQFQLDNLLKYDIAMANQLKLKEFGVLHRYFPRVKSSLHMIL